MSNAEPSPYPVGHVRPGFAALYGWAEFMMITDRSDSALRHLRTAFPDEFPEPIAVLSFGPVYLAGECQAFALAHPKKQVRKQLSDNDVRRIKLLASRDVGAADIAEVVGCTTVTVYRTLKRARGGYAK